MNELRIEKVAIGRQLPRKKVYVSRVEWAALRRVGLGWRTGVGRNNGVINRSWVN